MTEPKRRGKTKLLYTCPICKNFETKRRDTMKLHILDKHHLDSVCKYGNVEILDTINKPKPTPKLPEIDENRFTLDPEIKNYIKDENELSDDSSDESSNESEIKTNSSDDKYSIRQILFPDFDLTEPESISDYSLYLDKFPYLNGFSERVEQHADMYADLIEKNTILNKLPLSQKINNKTALLLLTSRDLTLTIADNMIKPKLNKFKSINSEMNNLIHQLGDVTKTVNKDYNITQLSEINELSKMAQENEENDKYDP